MFKSKNSPAVAALVGRAMARSGARIVPEGTLGAVEVVLELSAWTMPAGSMGRTAADIPVTQAIEQVLGEKAASADGRINADFAKRATGSVPLSGWSTQIGQTGMSVGLAGFLFENLGNVTGARAKFNAFFGADATGTVCLFPAKACARRKGPQQDFELRGTFEAGGQKRTIVASLLMVQAEPNILQPLAYAVADWRDAALGERMPKCQFWKSGDRTADCEPTPSPLSVEELR